MRKLPWKDLGLVALGLLAMALAVIGVRGVGEAVGDPSARSSGAIRTPVRAPDPRAVFLGDEWTYGTGDGATWATLFAEQVGWTEVNMGYGGTGYATSQTGDAAWQACGTTHCPSYPELVDKVVHAAPDIVIVSGGRHDGWASVSAPATLLFQELRSQVPDARVIVVSPITQLDPVPADLAGTSRGVRAAAQSVGVEYLDIGQPLAGRPDLMTDDGAAPNLAGHQVVADAVLVALQ